MRAALSRLQASEVFGIFAVICLVAAVAGLAGIWWALLLLGALLGGMAYTAFTYEQKAAAAQKELLEQRVRAREREQR